MTNATDRNIHEDWPTLGGMPTPARALATAILVVVAIGMTGALGQVIVHDIIPTFFDPSDTIEHGGMAETLTTQPGEKHDRGDLFSELAREDSGGTHTPFHRTEQFVWLLKWTHIHLFGMNMIFIFLGAITIFLNTTAKLRIWLVMLPFGGVFIDIAAMWLKTYVSTSFFWLHIPGGGLFAAVFVVVCVKALREMWGGPAN